MFLPKACLFDLDGLLLDTEPLHGKAWAKAAATFGTKLTENQLIELKGRPRNQCAQKVDAWLSKPVGKEQILSIQQPIARGLLEGSKAMPGAQELVRWCYEHDLPTALVTSSSSDSLAIKSAPHTWLGLIHTRILGDDPSLLAGKPSPEPFLLAAERLEVNPKECWAFEDSPAGEESALAAGCKLFVLKEKIKGRQLIQEIEKENPIYINNLNAIVSILDLIWNKERIN